MAAVAGLLLPAGASAAPARVTLGAWHAVSGAERRLLADDRYVVTRSRAGDVRALDTATGRTRRLAAPACDNGPSLPVAVGGGRLVWECASVVALGGHVVLVEDLASGRQYLPAGFAPFQALDRQSHDGSRFHVTSVGEAWIYLTRSGYHFADDVLVGLVRPEVAYNPGQRADLAVDPDRADGSRRLCAGIRRPAGEIELGERPFGALSYHRPYAIAGNGTLRACTGAPAVPRGRVVAALSERYLSWATGRSLRLRPTASRRTIRHDAPGTVRGIVLTRRFVYVTTGSGADARVHRARLTVRR